MKRQVSLYEAKTNLSQLVEDAARGDVIVIAKNGKPRAKLMLLETADTSPPQKRALGQWAKYLTPEQLADIGSEDWLRRWKEADAEIQQDFEDSLNRGFTEPGRDYKWADTSSTPTPSSGQKTSPRRSGPKRAKSSKTRKTRSS
jgi:prevent-host-death family protein